MPWKTVGLCAGGAAVVCGALMVRPCLMQRVDDDDDAVLRVPEGVEVVHMTEEQLQEQVNAQAPRDLLETLLMRNMGRMPEPTEELAGDADDDSDWEDLDSDSDLPHLEGFADDDDDDDYEDMDDDDEDDAEAGIAKLLSDPTFLRELIAQQQQIATDHDDDLADLADDLDPELLGEEENAFLRAMLAEQKSRVAPKKETKKSKRFGARGKKAGPKFKK